MVIKNILLDKLVKFGFVLMVVLYHVLPVSHIFLGEIKFLGKNIIIVIPVLFIGIAFLVHMRRLSVNWLYFIMFLVMFYGLLTTLSIIFYDADTGAFLDRRFFLIPLGMAIVTFRLLADVEYSWLVIRVFIATIIAQCTFGIVHHAFFGGMMYMASDFGYGAFEELGVGAGREAGTMISSSCYAYVLLTGMMVLAYLKNLPWGLSQIFPRWLLQFYLLYGILLSGSRGPIILAILTLVSMICNRQGMIKDKFIKALLIVLSIAGYIYFGFDDLIKSSIIERTLDGGTGGRYEKLLLVFSMLGQDVYLLTGVPLDVQATSEINGVVFSDNSFGTLFITFGAVSIAQIIVLFSMMFRFARDTHTIVPVLIGLVCLGTTNSILWEPWIFYYLVAMALILFSTRGSFSSAFEKGFMPNSLHGCLIYER